MRGRRQVRVNINRKKHRISDKWAKTIILCMDQALRKHIPLTKRMNKINLRSMLRTYGMVYVKPVFGSLGRGVMKVEQKRNSEGEANLSSDEASYSYQLGGRKQGFQSFDALYRSIKMDTNGKGYLVQKGIHLLKHEDRAFDLRLVVQQAPSGGWETTGIVGRVAHPHKIVTNGSQGGTILPVDYLLQSYTHFMEREQLLHQLEQLGVNTIKQLRKKYPGIREIGIDIALDKMLKPWILEVNMTPDHCPFAILRDQSMIEKIMKYGKAYGRTYKLKCMKAKQGESDSP